ncbi:MAG: Patatin [Daejeonella sp.]|nr:Patatin [Daejeonella sp.]
MHGLPTILTFWLVQARAEFLQQFAFAPSPNDPTKARFSAKQAVDLYIKNGYKIFDVPLWKKIQTMNGITDEKYDAAPIESCLEEYFQEIKLSELLKPCLITSYDIRRRATHFFAQHDYAKKGDGFDFYVKDVCRATSAAPTYFETALIKSISGVSYPLVDGGVFANNPSLCAYSEVRNAIGFPTAKDMFIVSIGTGSENKTYDYDEAKGWGAVGWIRPVIDIMMAGNSETTHYHLTKMFLAGGNQSNYTRLQPASLGNANPEMDDATEENIQALIEVGIETSQNCSDELDRIVDILLEGEDKVEF